MDFRFAPYTLIFKENAGTSRGVLKVKPTFFIQCRDSQNPERIGYGEAPWFPGLSPESECEFTECLKSLETDFSVEKVFALKGFSALKFGVQQCILDIANGSLGIYFPSPFTQGKKSIQINGLIWMGKKEEMRRRINEKIREGFQCIKIKIGAISWDDELDLLCYIRDTCGSDVEIRVDANGALNPSECMARLEQLSRYDIHSIEQPIKAGLNYELRDICKNTPVPVALDESLIGIDGFKEKTDILEFIQPQYIVLKPSLCGGFSGTLEWINIAESLDISWWITSALESSLGLDILAQFTSQLGVGIPQGLGTGNLYRNNLPSPLSLNGEYLKFDGPTGTYRQFLDSLFD